MILRARVGLHIWRIYKQVNNDKLLIKKINSRANLQSCQQIQEKTDDLEFTFRIVCSLTHDSMTVIPQKQKKMFIVLENWSWPSSEELLNFYFKIL